MVADGAVRPMWPCVCGGGPKEASWKSQDPAKCRVKDHGCAVKLTMCVSVRRVKELARISL